MKVQHSSNHLRRLCHDSAYAQRRLGPDSARKLRARLADLDAAARLGEIVNGTPHPLRGDRAGQFAICLAGGDRLVLVADEEPVRLTDDGACDWPAVEAIRVVFIGDYHD